MCSAFKTSVPEKLYSALQDELNDDTDIGRLMNTWVTQVGYPVIEINVQSNRQDIYITQKRFLLNDANHSDKSTWEIPLNYATSLENEGFSQTTTKFLLSTSDKLINDTFDKPIDWIIFNVQQTGE